MSHYFRAYLAISKKSLLASVFKEQSERMINLDLYKIDPKHYPAWWKSERYRAWIRKNLHCYCGRPLNEQEGWLHHHRATGGKDKPHDQLLSRVCANEHAKIHASAKSKRDVYTRFGLTDDIISQHCAEQLLRYIIEELGGLDSAVNMLGELARGLEYPIEDLELERA